MNSIRSRSIFIPYFISGFTALVFESVWSRQTCLIFGNTTLASATVISAFMTGLAVGSYIFGKIADSRPQISLKLYAILEGAVGLFALFFPLLTRLLTPLYRIIYIHFYNDFLNISLLRFILSFSIFMIPTVFMGGTFPLLSRFMGKDERSARINISRLYMVNLFGAVAGSFAAGFFLIGILGLNITSFIAAIANLGIFAYIIRLALTHGGDDIAATPVKNAGLIEETPFLHADMDIERKRLWIIAALMAIQGFCAFVIQICWLRIMALILGSSTYAFSAVLTTFLIGLGLGTYAINLLAKKGIRLRLYHLGFMELFAGVSVLLFIPIFEWLIYFMVLILPLISGATIMVFTIQFIFCALAMIVPAFVIGLVFPSALYYLGRPRDVGRWVGTTYALNTAGGVLGSFLAAFFFIGRFGLNGSLHIISVFTIAAGIAVIFISSRNTDKLRPNMKRAWAAASLSFLLIFYPWDKNMFSSGAFIYASSMQKEAWLGKDIFQKAIQLGHELLYYKDGISSTVSVLQYRSGQEEGSIKPKSLRVNGKTDATTIGDMDTQLCLGYLPLFAHKDPKKILVIGLGAGITLSAVSEFESVTSIDCVEIEPAVVEANRFFSSENNDILSDPRVKIIIGDGRNHIEFTDSKYDVIISEPSNPWVSGISTLFSKENYEAALNKLAPDGIYCQWFHAYQMSKGDFIMVMRTFSSVFPEVNLYKVSVGDYILLGSRKTIVFDYQRMLKLIQNNKVLQNHLNYFSKYGEQFILGTFMLSSADLKAAMEKEKGPLNTDDRLFLEYHAPKYLYASTSDDIVNWLYSIPRHDAFPQFSNADRNMLLNIPNIWKVFMENGLFAAGSKNYDSAIFYFTEALRHDPADPAIIAALANSYERKKDYANAKKLYQMLLPREDFKKDAERSLLKIKLKEEIEKNPMMWRDAVLFDLLGLLEFLTGYPREAERYMLQAINIDPTYPKIYCDMALFYFFTGFEDKGFGMLRKATLLGCTDPAMKKAEEAWQGILRKRRLVPKLKSGITYISLRRFAQAKPLFEDVLREEPDNLMANGFLAIAEAGLGNKELADKYKAKADELYAEQVKRGESEVKGEEITPEVKDKEIDLPGQAQPAPEQTPKITQ